MITYTAKRLFQPVNKIEEITDLQIANQIRDLLIAQWKEAPSAELLVKSFNGAVLMSIKYDLLDELEIELVFA